MPRQHKSTGLPPAHWPSSLQYISTQTYHSSVPTHLLAFIRLNLDAAPSHAPTTTDLKGSVVIRPISDVSHPAKGQYGLFAAKKIPPRSFILDYVGEVHCDDRPDSDCDLSLYRSQDGTSVGIDASRMGNAARFINDYRGIKPKPNAIFADYRHHVTGELKMCIWSGNEGIKKGDEILVSYGKAWWSARCSQENHNNT